MKFPRASGILLHPTSLPGPYGIGDLGAAAYEFVDFLHAAGQRIWQVLPLTPTGYGDSPYQAFSAFAGNPLLISLDRLVEAGLLDSAHATLPDFTEDRVDFGRVIPFKLTLLRQAAENFFRSTTASAHQRYQTFCAANAEWLEDFALFMSLKYAHDLVAWTDWPREIALRKPDALEWWRRKLAGEIRVQKYWQFVFSDQWSEIKNYANARGIRIMGDLPIYVAHDSSDVWAHPELFHLDEAGRPTRVAGVPPDYFSATGQLWGNPIYRWDRMQGDGFAWWIERVRAALARFDMVRLDHFRGFEAYWEVPAGEPTAINGRWVTGPGADLFNALQAALGELPIVAENLGVITPEVEAIRHQFGFPGMAIVQFAFSTDAQAPTFRPHNFPRELVAYTGGHDNDTMVGWWNAGIGDSTRTAEDVERERQLTREYMDLREGDEINWAFIRAVMASVADTVIIPLQDVLGVGTEGRMNLPGRLGGNWQWRYRSGSIKSEYVARLKKFAELYDR